MVLMVLSLNILLFLAVFFPWEIGQKADTFSSAPQGIRPEWYFMFMFQSLKLLPAHILSIEGEVVGVLFFVIVAIIWLLVPFWALKSPRTKGIRPMTLIGLAGIIFILVMTIIGYLN